MQKKTIYIIKILFCIITTCLNGQITQNDSLLTSNSDFNFIQEGSVYYLIPNYTCNCFKKGEKYSYEYYRGELEGQIPIQYYTKAQEGHSFDTIDFLKKDTVLTVYYLGSITNSFCKVYLKPNSANIEMTFFDFTERKCDTKLFDKTAILFLIEERGIQSGILPYDTYTRISLIKKR